MSKIGRHNYEEFFLDYLDGALNSDQINELDIFLSLHPDLKRELDEMDCPVLVQGKSSIMLDPLKEIPFRISFDDFCIARLEGDLSLDKEMAFDLFVERNEALKREQDIYIKTFLISDEKIVYKNKRELKKDARKLAIWWYLSRFGVAASVLLLFSLWYVFYQYEDINIDNKSISEVQLESTKIENVLLEKELSVVVDKKAGATSKTLKKAKKKLQKQSKATLQIKEEKRLERVSLPVVRSISSLAVLTNEQNIETKLAKAMQITNSGVDQNSGLAQLGMTWKSSAPKNKSSVLYAIAKYGVDKIGEIAGKNVKIEKVYNSLTDKTRLNFKSEGVGFSKTIK